VKKKNEDGPDKDTVFRVFTDLMSRCDDAVEETVKDELADITDMSSQVVNVMMAIEFAYVCYRNRLKIFMESLNEAAEVTIFDDDDLRDAVDYARVNLHPMLRSIMVADKKMFKRSLEVVSMDDETDPENRINVKTRGDA